MKFTTRFRLSDIGAAIFILLLIIIATSCTSVVSFGGEVNTNLDAPFSHELSLNKENTE